MRWKPDRETYATGYGWLDKVTDPYWRIALWWSTRKWWRAHARPGESWKEARDRYQPLYAGAFEEWEAKKKDPRQEEGPT